MSCSRIYNDYDGIQYDYTRKQGLVWQQVFPPDMDAMELDTARHAIRPGKERETAQRLQTAHGKKFDYGTLARSRKDVAAMMDESAEPVSIRQTLQQLQGQQNRQGHEKERSQER